MTQADDSSRFAIKELTKARFEALVSYIRHPLAEVMGQERRWFANLAESVLGVVLLDLVDLDYAAIVLGRDPHKKFRSIDANSEFPDEKSALAWLTEQIEQYSLRVSLGFEQGDEAGSKCVKSLFEQVVPQERLNPSIIELMNNPGHSPARGIISEMMPHFVDIDGNFVEQFQTTGFDARLWELYLFAYLNEEKFLFDRTYNAPDFVVNGSSGRICIEAVTVGRKSDEKSDIDLLKDSTVREYMDYMGIRFGSSLYSKLNKHYWELPHVEGVPLVFAIADFHDDESMLRSSTSLVNYLFGMDQTFSFSADGDLIIKTHRIESHKYGSKVIPSGFFAQRDSQYVSAILFSLSGTLSKFNRMGKLAGFGSSEVRLFRYGFCHNHEPNAVLPEKFSVEVDPEYYTESWAEGLSMFHNPNALNPIDMDLFPSIAHHYFSDGQLRSLLPPFHPYGSRTLCVVKKTEGDGQNTSF